MASLTLKVPIDKGAVLLPDTGVDRDAQPQQPFELAVAPERASIASEVQDDSYVRTGQPSPPADVFWRFKLFLDGVYSPQPGSEDAQNLCWNVTEVINSKRLSRATPTYRRWIRFQTRSFVDWLSPYQLKSDADLNEEYIRGDCYERMLRQKRKEGMTRHGTSFLETGLITRGWPLIGDVMPLLRKFDFRFKLNVSESKLREVMSERFYCGGNWARQAALVNGNALYDTLIQNGEKLDLSMRLTPLRPLSYKVLFKEYARLVKKAFLYKNRRGDTSPVSDLFEFFNKENLRQLPIYGRLNLEGKEDLEELLQFYKSLQPELRKAVESAAEGKTWEDQQRNYFRSLGINDRAITTEEDSRKYEKIGRDDIDLDMQRDSYGRVMYPDKVENYAGNDEFNVLDKTMQASFLKKVEKGVLSKTPGLERVANAIRVRTEFLRKLVKTLKGEPPETRLKKEKRKSVMQEAGTDTLVVTGGMETTEEDEYEETEEERKKRLKKEGIEEEEEDDEEKKERREEGGMQRTITAQSGRKKGKNGGDYGVPLKGKDEYVNEPGSPISYLGPLKLNQLQHTEHEKLWKLLGNSSGCRDEVNKYLYKLKQMQDSDVENNTSSIPDVDDPYWRSDDLAAQEKKVDTDNKPFSFTGKLKRTCIAVDRNNNMSPYGGIEIRWTKENQLVVDMVTYDRTKIGPDQRAREILVPLCMVRDERLCRAFFSVFFGRQAVDKSSKRKVGNAVMEVLNGKTMRLNRPGVVALPMGWGIFSLTQSLEGSGRGDRFIMNGIEKKKALVLKSGGTVKAPRIRRGGGEEEPKDDVVVMEEGNVEDTTPQPEASAQLKEATSLDDASTAESLLSSALVEEESTPSVELVSAEETPATA